MTFTIGNLMTSAFNTFGRPPIYPLGPMAVGDTIELDAPTSADIKRICRAVSSYGQRHDRGYMCRTRDGVMTITRRR